uniref:Uncharacterized protein n=1 Tax=Panagrolaimus superbus TaxID=310955 RepID=A0A914YY47_9BILA
MTAWIHGLFFLVIFVGLGCSLKDLGAPTFNCPGLMAPSATVPSSVHALRPADIKVVAALGDSLTAANGAGAPKEDAVAILLQYRGLAFQGGGDKGINEHVTIPRKVSIFKC